MYEVYNLETDESHGEFDTLDEARGCVAFDRLAAYEILDGARRPVEIKFAPRFANPYE